jgi:hypothetical protein
MFRQSDRGHNSGWEELLNSLLHDWSRSHRMRNEDVESVKLSFVSEQLAECMEEYEELQEEILELTGEDWQGEEYIQEALDYMQEVYEEIGIDF